MSLYDCVFVLIIWIWRLGAFLSISLQVRFVIIKTYSKNYERLQYIDIFMKSKFSRIDVFRRHNNIDKILIFLENIFMLQSHMKMWNVYTVTVLSLKLWTSRFWSHVHNSGPHFTRKYQIRNRTFWATGFCFKTRGFDVIYVLMEKTKYWLPV